MEDESEPHEVAAVRHHLRRMLGMLRIREDSDVEARLSVIETDYVLVKTEIFQTIHYIIGFVHHIAVQLGAFL